MPTDYWLIFAYFMIFFSVVLCGIIPMIFRLLNARRRFHRYDLERQVIRYSCPHAFLTLQSIYSDVQLDISDIDDQNFQRINSPEEPIIYEQIRFIDDDTSV
jgi:hypothetical protein